MPRCQIACLTMVWPARGIEMLIALIVQTSASHASQSQNLTATLDKLLEWAPAVGIKCPNIGPYTSPSGLQGMAATQHIRADEVCLACFAEKASQHRWQRSKCPYYLTDAQHFALAGA